MYVPSSGSVCLRKPHFSPHGPRRRRGSLHYKRTGSLAEIATFLGDSKRVAAEHDVCALTDYREVDRAIALALAIPQIEPATVALSPT